MLRNVENKDNIFISLKMTKKKKATYSLVYLLCSLKTSSFYAFKKKNCLFASYVSLFIFYVIYE